MFCLQHPSTTSMLPTWTSSSKCNILECKQISDLGRSKSRWFLERYMTFTNWISNRSDHTQQCFEYGVFEYTHYKRLRILVTKTKIRPSTKFKIVNKIFHPETETLRLAIILNLTRNRSKLNSNCFTANSKISTDNPEDGLGSNSHDS